MANNDLRRRLLDARPDRLDLRDRKFVPRVASLPERFPDTRWAAQIADYVRAGHVLDQGSEGACTGFGLAAVVNYLYWRATGRTTIVSPRMLYHLAQFYDEWRGEDYTGSSCRGALKGWHKHGVCLRKFWPYTVDAQGTAPHFEAPLPGWETDAPRAAALKLSPARRMVSRPASCTASASRSAKSSSAWPGRMTRAACRSTAGSACSSTAR